MNRKKVAIITTLRLEKNPMAHFHVATLKEKYDVKIAAFDEKAAHLNELKPYFENLETKKYLRQAVFIYRLLKVLSVFLFPLNYLFELFARNTKPGSKTLAAFREGLYLVALEYNLKRKYLIKFLETFNPDTIIVIDAGALPAAKYFKKKTQVPFAYFVYELYPDQSESTVLFAHMMMKKVESTGTRLSDMIVGYGTSCIARLIKLRYKLGDIKTETINNCPPVIQEYSKPVENYPVKFYYHGLLSANRGLEQLFMAMQLVDKSIAQLYVRGFGQHKSYFQDLVEKNNLSEKIFFLDIVTPTELPIAGIPFDVGITISELNYANGRFQSGFKTFDNIGSGLAIMAVESYVLKELVDTYDLGMTFKNTKAETIASVIKKMASDISTLNKWKTNSRKAFLNFFNRAQQSKKLNRVVDFLLDRERP